MTKSTKTTGAAAANNTTNPHKKVVDAITSVKKALEAFGKHRSGNGLASMRIKGMQKKLHEISKELALYGRD